MGFSSYPEDVEAHVVFTLKTGNTDAGQQNPGPLDVVVGVPHNSDGHSTLHVPAGT